MPYRLRPRNQQARAWIFLELGNPNRVLAKQPFDHVERRTAAPGCSRRESFVLGTLNALISPNPTLSDRQPSSPDSFSVNYHDRSR